MGLDGPRTSAQEQMVQRMYNTMVLDKPDIADNGMDAKR